MNRLTLFMIMLFSFVINLPASSGTDSIGYFLQGTDTVVIYEVGTGETLSGIARKYRISVAGITVFNPTLQPDQLKEGQIIKLPGAQLRHRYRSEGSASVTSAPQLTKPATSVSTSKHTIMQGETLYAIARHYGLTVEELILANPGLQPDKIYAGQEIAIPGKAAKQPAISEPTPAPAATPKREQGPSTTELVKASDISQPAVNDTEPVAAQPTATKDVITHVVKKGETMFSISRQYDVTVTDIKEWNKMQSFQIDIGDELVVGYSKEPEASPPATSAASTQLEVGETPKPATAPAVTQSRFAYEGMDNILSLQYKEDLSSHYYVEERNNGIATWISDVDGYPYENGYFALHRSLPIGTVLKVRNLMNDKIVFAKVIGRLPNTDANEKIMLKLPEAAKENLKVLDAQLVMEVSYLRKMN